MKKFIFISPKGGPKVYLIAKFLHLKENKTESIENKALISINADPNQYRKEKIELSRMCVYM